VKPIKEQKEIVLSKTYDFIYRLENHIFVVLRSSHKGKLLGLTRSTAGPRIKPSQIEWVSSYLQKLEQETDFSTCEDKKHESNTNEEKGKEEKLSILEEEIVFLESEDKESKIEIKEKEIKEKKMF